MKKINIKDNTVVNKQKKSNIARKILLGLMVFWTICSILGVIAFGFVVGRKSSFNVVETSADSRSVPSGGNSVVFEFTPSTILSTSEWSTFSTPLTEVQLSQVDSVQFFMPFTTFDLVLTYDVSVDSSDTSKMLMVATQISNDYVTEVAFSPDLRFFSTVFNTTASNAQIIYDYIDNADFTYVGEYFYFVIFRVNSSIVSQVQMGDTFNNCFTYRVLELDDNGSYQEGYEDGYASGEESGYQNGYASGEQSGYQDGYSTGLDVSSAGFFYDSSLQLTLKNVDYGNNVYQDIPYTDIFGALTPSKYVFGGIDFSEFDYIYDYVTSVTGQLNADWVATVYILTFRNPVPIADLLLFATGVTSSFMSPVTLTAVDGTLLSGRFDINNSVNGGYSFVFDNTKSLLIDSLSWSGSGGYGSFNFAFSVQNYGYNQGYQNGYDEGALDSIEENREKWIAEGYQNGYNVGKNDGLATAERSSFYSLITSAIDVPINAVLDAMNFEILGVDMKGFFTGLLTLCIIIWIIRLVL